MTERRRVTRARSATNRAERSEERGEILRDASVVIGNWDFTATRRLEQPFVGKIAAIGDKNVVFAFKSIGAEIYPFTADNKIKKTIKELIEQKCAIILITEREAEQINDYLNTLSDKAYPIILPIPNGVGGSGYGLSRVNEHIIKAVGSH